MIIFPIVMLIRPHLFQEGFPKAGADGQPLILHSYFLLIKIIDPVPIDDVGFVDLDKLTG